MRAATLTVLLLSSACAPSKLAANFIVHPIRLPVVGAPAAPHEDFSVKTADGLTLRGWRFPVEQPRGLVVMLHGKDANRQHFLEPALRLREQGFIVAAYDQRGHGASDEATITYGVREVADVRAVLDALQPGNLPVYVVGESLGAAVALQATAVEPRIKGVVAAASFSDLRTLLKEKTPFFFSNKELADTFDAAELEAQFDLDSASPVKAAPNITVPALLLHGTIDGFIPAAHSVRIYEALGGKKELVRLEGVNHIDVLLHRESWDTIERFLTSM